MEEQAVNLSWRKSSYSNGGSDNCVEAAHALGAVLIRDTKNNGTGPVLRLTLGEWCRFTAAIRADRALS
jgi:hypothetical protein